MRTRNMHAMAVVVGLMFIPALAAAQDPAPAEPAAAPPTEPAAAPADTGAAEAAPEAKSGSSAMINIDVEAASAYVWRGINLYGETQDTQNFSIFPTITASFGGLAITYLSAYQLTGDNKELVLDQGTGGQQTLILKYSGSATDDLGYYGQVIYWVYPFADPDVANTDLPMILEPGAGITYSTAPVDLGLYVGYFRPLQDVNEAGSFVYISPSVAKAIPLTGDIDLALSLAAGFKGYTNLPSGADGDRVFDLTLNVGTTLPFSDMYITPQLHAAYVTRVDDLLVGTPGDQGPEFGDQFVAWAGVHVGYNIGL